MHTHKNPHKTTKKQRQINIPEARDSLGAKALLLPITTDPHGHQSEPPTPTECGPRSPLPAKKKKKPQQPGFPQKGRHQFEMRGWSTETPQSIVRPRRVLGSQENLELLMRNPKASPGIVDFRGTPRGQGPQKGPDVSGEFQADRHTVTAECPGELRLSKMAKGGPQP